MTDFSQRLTDRSTPLQIHLIGVAGSGMSGLALLLKGPVPVAMVAIILSIYLVLTCPKGPAGGHHWWWRKLWLLHPLLGTAVMLSIAAPWYITEGLVTKGAFLQEFFITSGKMKHTLQVSLDIFNFGNMVSKNWGVRQITTTTNPLIFRSINNTTENKPLYRFQNINGNLVTDPHKHYASGKPF